MSEKIWSLFPDDAKIQFLQERLSETPEGARLDLDVEHYSGTKSVRHEVTLEEVLPELSAKTSALNQRNTMLHCRGGHWFRACDVIGWRYVQEERRDPSLAEGAKAGSVCSATDACRKSQGPNENEHLLGFGAGRGTPVMYNPEDKTVAVYCPNRAILARVTRSKNYFRIQLSDEPLVRRLWMASSETFWGHLQKLQEILHDSWTGSLPQLYVTFTVD